MRQRSLHNLVPLIGLLIMISACDLEPVYITPSSAVNDGVFTWVSGNATAPAGYEPVLFSPPDGAPPLAVCRAEVVDPGFERGPHTGMLVNDPADGSSVCWVAHRRQTIRFDEYEQLWAQQGALYRWEAHKHSVETLLTTKYYRNNRVVNEPMVSIPTGRAVIIWHSCADMWQGKWYLGKVGLGEGIQYRCEIPLGEDFATTRGTALLLYAPADK